MSTDLTQVRPRMIYADEIRANLRLEDLIEPVSEAFQKTSSGLAENGLIVMFPSDRRDSGDVYVKTSTLRGSSIFVVKVSPWFACNLEPGSSQGGFVSVFDSRTGHTLAFLHDGHYLSDLRTAAAGALAARVLAPTSIKTAAVLGAGVQAYWQPLALYSERRFERLMIWARNPEKAEALKRRLQIQLPAVRIEISADLERMIREADVIISATQARRPLIHGAWLHEGQHITAVGADDPTKCELDSVALRRARVFVDTIIANEANGDVFQAIQRKEYEITALAGEIGRVLSGTTEGRVSENDITIAKFVGIGAQDLAAAEVCLRKCQLGMAHVAGTKAWAEVRKSL